MRVISSAALSASLLLLACGRDAQPAAAPEAPAPAAPAQEFAAPPPPPAPAAESESREESLSSKDEEQDALGEAEAELARAQAELDGALAPGRAGPPAAGAAAPTRSPRPAETAAQDAEAPKSKPEKKATAENGCATACRAFASLGRAAGAVCRLTGDSDERCTRAKGMVSDAQKRVTSCGCRSE